SRRWRAHHQYILNEKPSERPGDVIPVQYGLFPYTGPADAEDFTVHLGDTGIDAAPSFIKEITKRIDILFFADIVGHFLHFEIQIADTSGNLLCKHFEPWLPPVGIPRDIRFIQFDDRHV